MDPIRMDDKQLEVALEATEQTDNPASTPSEAGQVDKGAGKKEGSVTPTQAPAESTPTLETIQAEMAKLKEQLKEKDKFAGRLTNELGQLRKQMTAPKKELPPEPTDDDFLTKPKESIKALNEREKAEEAQNKAKQDEQIQLVLEANRNVVYTTVPNFDESQADIEKMLVEDDKLDPKMVQGFLSNPFYADPVVLIQMARRASARTELASTKAELAKLQEQVEQLKKKPGQVLDRLEKAAKAGPTMNSTTGRSESSKTNPVSDAQRAAMSYEQLQEALKNSDGE